MRTHHHLPQPPGGADGAALFAFVLGTNVTATLTTAQVEAAAHASRWIVASPDVTDQTREHYSRTVRVLLDVLARRRLRDVQEDGETGGAGGAGQDTPNLGPMARLTPEPDTRPPDGDMVDPYAQETVIEF